MALEKLTKFLFKPKVVDTLGDLIITQGLLLGIGNAYVAAQEQNPKDCAVWIAYGLVSVGIGVAYEKLFCRVNKGKNIDEL